jgi:hypothetical protein
VSAEVDEPEALPRRLAEQPGWQWLPGMLTHAGLRVTEGADVPADALPDLADWPTVGALLGMIAAFGALTDVVHGPDGWIVAVEIEGDITGYAADVPGEAAAWALLAVWENLSGEFGIA